MQKYNAAHLKFFFLGLWFFPGEHFYRIFQLDVTLLPMHQQHEAASHLQHDSLQNVHPIWTIPDFPYPQEIRARKILRQNVVLRLRQRETVFSSPGTHFHVARQFYTNVFPNLTINNVEKPPCFLRKFSPTGKHFIAFSLDQTMLEIYEFQGSGAAGDLLQNVKGDSLPNASERVMNDVRNKLFDQFFVKKHSSVITSNGEHLNRECSLFTDDGKFVIVGSATFLPDGNHPLASELYRNNESVTSFRVNLEDYSLHIVELATGHVCDCRRFCADKIFLSHNQGLYLYKSTLAVLSVQHQTIHIFQVSVN